MTIASRRLGLSVLVCLVACRAQRTAPLGPVRLVDAYRTEVVQDRVPPDAPRARTEWRFDGPAGQDATRGFTAGTGIASLSVRDGHLTGRTVTDFPILRVERRTDAEDRDVVHEIQVRLRVSAGRNLAVAWRGADTLDFPEIAQRGRVMPWRTTTPLVPGTEVRTYTVRPGRPIVGSELRQLLVRPTDAEGATFELESVRLVFRREHLASVPSGVGFQGLGEVYRETLVSRAPETLKFKVRVPPRALLDLSVGTPEEQPVTFVLSLAGGNGGEEPLITRTVTRPHVWQQMSTDLSRYAGREVALTLGLKSDRRGTIGFWGAPTLRPRVAAARPPGRPQGVIVIWADTLRRDHLGMYGYGRPTSPRLDALAGQGVLFRDAVGHATWTKVATPSLLTSLYPTSHGVKEFTDRLPASVTTLAEVYRQAGYATISLSSILFTGRFTNLHQGFEVVHEDGSLPDQESSKTSREYVDRLLSWLDQHAEVPFFAFLHVSDPHDPFRPHAPYDTMWADASGGDEHERQAREVKKFISDPLLKSFGMPNREELLKAGFDPDRYVAYERDWYDGAIREMDTEIGRLVEGLDARGLGGRVLVAFAADHGEEFLEHGRMFHGQTVYGELSGVPLVLWQPGVLPARVVEETVQVIDVMPTLLALSGLGAPAGIQGRSLAPYFAPGPAGTVQAAAALPAIVEKAVITDMGGPPPRDTASVAIVEGDWKLVHHTVRPNGGPEFELFEHHSDRLDLRNVAAAHPDVVARLSRSLAAWRKAAEAARLPPEEATKNMSREELERLRALGYIQ
jgi:arylsulfatase A-like enzyme